MKKILILLLVFLIILGGSSVSLAEHEDIPRICNYGSFAASE